ncbi:MAG: response regulator [Deltaproteobacteria bacterium]|nr:response regulator [Deltaproteobacteria bacterium]
MNENRRILVVDDEPEIRRGYRTILCPEREKPLLSSRLTNREPPRVEGETFEVTEAESGEQALGILARELAAGRPFAGAIVDVRMPGSIDGLELIKRAWALDSGLLVVVATAYQDRSVDDIARFFGGGFQDQWDYLNKPFTSGEIIQKARNLVSSWNRRARERAYVEQIEAQSHQLLAQEQLAAVGRMAHSIGHDLGNILQQVLAKLDTALPQGPRSGEPVELTVPDLEELIEGVELGATICQDLLTFARKIKEASPPARVRVGASIHKALRLLRHELARKDIAVTETVDAEAECLAHDTRLVQVFVNLMTNAVQAMGEGGALRVSAAREPDGGVLVEIADNGAGISAENMARVFEPLFTTKGENGNGVGLTVCKSIVESYGGTIRLDSRPGAGTTAVIRFSK